jgi:hypothetical protein
MGDFMSRLTAFSLGALGGLLPILVSLLTVDLAPIIDDHSALTLGNYLGYGIRVFVLVVLGGTMALLNGEVTQPFSIVQLGIAAPALVTSFINGTSPAAPVAAPTHAFFSVVSSANAREARTPGIQLAGTLFDHISAGLGTRLDTLNNTNKDISRSDAVQSPDKAATGNKCMTAYGAFDAAKDQPTGSQCTVSTPKGTTFGYITK